MLCGICVVTRRCRRPVVFRVPSHVLQWASSSAPSPHSRVHSLIPATALLRSLVFALRAYISAERQPGLVTEACCCVVPLLPCPPRSISPKKKKKKSSARLRTRRTTWRRASLERSSSEGWGGRPVPLLVIHALHAAAMLELLVNSQGFLPRPAHRFRTSAWLLQRYS
jgi:hypothetical protein